MTPDELDQRLRDALRVDPGSEQLDRLGQFWLRASKAERRRRLRAPVAAVAAAASMAAVAWLALSAGDRRDSLREPRIDPTPLVAASPAPPSAPRTSPVAARVAGREPTPYERLLFAARTRTALPERRASQQGDSQSPEPTPDERSAALLASLSQDASPASIPDLLLLAEQPAFRDEALTTVVRILGAENLASALSPASSAGVRGAMLDRLLTARSDVALRQFLAVAADPAMRAEALAVAAAASARHALPVASLMQALESNNRSTRLAAALVLGHVDGPVISQSLIARVSRRRSAPAEAWVALLACRDAAVDRFLAQAVLQPRMLGQVNNARLYWARIVF